MSKLIVDDIELSGGTSLSLPTTRPDNNILKVSSNKLVFDTKPSVSLQTIYDYNVDGATGGFYYELTNDPATLVGIYIEIDAMQATSGNGLFFVDARNSLNTRVSFSAQYSAYIGHAYNSAVENATSRSDFGLLASETAGVNYSAGAEDVRYQHSGSFFLITDGLHSNLAQSANSVTLASMQLSRGSKQRPTYGPMTVATAFESNNTDTTVMTNFDAQDFTKLLIGLSSNIVSGVIRLAEIPRSN